MPNNSNPCPCGSPKNYHDCCGIFISGKKKPHTAEQLMRSRYTAYTQANIAYIQATMRGKASEGFDAADAEIWAKKVKWKRLKVIETFPHKTNLELYYVKFTAHYIWEGKPQQLTETSEFKNIDGIWYYIDHV